MKYQSEIRVHHIEMEHSFLSKTIEPVSTADFVLQELEEDAYSIDDHDQVMNEVSKSRQSRVLLRQVVNYDGVVLNCFLCAVDQIRHILPGTSIIKRLENANLAKGSWIMCSTNHCFRIFSSVIICWICNIKNCTV